MHCDHSQLTVGKLSLKSSFIYIFVLHYDILNIPIQGGLSLCQNQYMPMNFLSSNIIVSTFSNKNIMNKKITSLRLLKEEQSLKKQPLSQAIVTRRDFLTFHFCLFGLEEDFSGGFYHGVLELPEDYPFSPPKIKFLTQNGRFEVNKPICTTFTHYHKETWSSSWNIKTILTALISFMYSNEKGIGGIFYTPSRRKALAKKSLRENISNPLFLQLFKEELLNRNLLSSSQLEAIISKIQLSPSSSKLSVQQKQQSQGNEPKESCREGSPLNYQRVVSSMSEALQFNMLCELKEDKVQEQSSIHDKTQKGDFQNELKHPNTQLQDNLQNPTPL